MKYLMKLSSPEIFQLFLSLDPDSGMNILKAHWSPNLFWISLWKKSLGKRKIQLVLLAFPGAEEYFSLGFTVN